MSYFPWLILIAILLLYWWHSGVYKGKARRLAVIHCEQYNLQLLDQSMVIRGIWPERNASGRLTLRRTYQFEFTSTGDQRYQGVLVLQGIQLESIELDAYKVPDSD